ncbi:hypothetical protein AB0D37_43885 [Streptomyces sp. NPDC048384]|uniref:hypothetical protein n=1 Tax=Streptomyces sp. NPDC048384 TaxID=3155487 RepID=UPI003439D666
MWDDGAVCTQTGFWRNAQLEEDLPRDMGAEMSSSATRLCQNNPAAGQRAADIGDNLSWLLFSSLALLLFSHLMKGVRLRLLADTVARRLAALGRFVTVGTPLTDLVTG